MTTTSKPATILGPDRQRYLTQDGLLAWARQQGVPEIGNARYLADFIEGIEQSRAIEMRRTPDGRWVRR